MWGRKRHRFIFLTPNFVIAPILWLNIPGFSPVDYRILAVLHERVYQQLVRDVHSPLPRTDPHWEGDTPNPTLWTHLACRPPLKISVYAPASDVKNSCPKLTWSLKLPIFGWFYGDIATYHISTKRKYIWNHNRSLQFPKIWWPLAYKWLRYSHSLWPTPCKFRIFFIASVFTRRSPKGTQPNFDMFVNEPDWKTVVKNLVLSSLKT